MSESVLTKITGESVLHNPIDLQQNIIEINKLNFMMKYDSDFLPTKF